MQSWKTLSRRVILDYSKFLKIEEHVVELPDGRVIADWPWVVTPDFVNVVVETDGGQFLCFRQTKYGLEGLSLAPVGGYLEPGEEPLAAARRELREETGYEAPNWTPLGSFRANPNRGCGIGYFFLARGAQRVTEPIVDDLEEQEMLFLSRTEMETAVTGGEFKSLPWLASVMLALRRLED